MENQNIQQLIEAISASPELQQQLQAEADKPVTRGADDRGIGSAILSSIAQAAGINFSSSDMSQLSGMLSQVGGLVGNSAAQPSGGGLQLLNASASNAAQSAAPAMNVDSLLSMFAGGNTQAATNNLTSLLGGGNVQAQQQVSGAGLGDFLSMFAGANQPQAQASGMSGASILKLLLKLFM